jgi:hypothetical protein
LLGIQRRNWALSKLLPGGMLSSTDSIWGLGRAGLLSKRCGRKAMRERRACSSERWLKSCANTARHGASRRTNLPEGRGVHRMVFEQVLRSRRLYASHRLLVRCHSARAAPVCGAARNSTSPIRRQPRHERHVHRDCERHRTGRVGKVVVSRPTAKFLFASFAVSTTYGFSIVLLNVTGPTTVYWSAPRATGPQVTASGPGQAVGALAMPGGYRQRYHHGDHRESHLTALFQFDAHARQRYADEHGTSMSRAGFSI